jgi:Na+/melibiose symporter-like transporter
LSFYFLYYLTAIVGMSPVDAGILVGLPAAFLFPLDPVAGILSDRVRSRVGRRRVFIITCGPIAAVCFLLRFYAPAAFSMSALFAFWFVMQLVHGTSSTLTMVSYTALTAELSPSSKERAQIVSLQQVLGLVGMVTGAALTTPIAAAFGNGSLGFTRMATVYAMIIGLVFLTAFGVTSKRQTISEQSATLKETALILRNRPFWFQSGVWFLTSGVGTIVNALLVFYLTYVLSSRVASAHNATRDGRGGGFRPVLECSQQPTGQTCSHRVRGSYVWAALISLLFVSEYDVFVLWPIACLAGAGSASLSFLRTAMMTDYIAYDDARVGHSRAGNITGILGLGNRAGSAIGGLLAG